MQRVRIENKQKVQKQSAFLLDSSRIAKCAYFLGYFVLFSSAEGYDVLFS